MARVAGSSRACWKSKGRQLKKWLLTLAFVAAVVFMFRNFMMEQSAAPALSISLTAAAQGDCPETIRASGWLKPWQEAIITSETSGRISEVLVDVGSVVTKGQTLARLSQEAALADIRMQDAAVRIAKANLAKAQATIERARQLRASGTTSQDKIAEYLEDEQIAIATVASAEAALASEKVKLVQTTITAVDDGLVTSRSAELGATVSAGAELFRLVSPATYRVAGRGSARDLPRISEGMNVNINGPDDRANSRQGKARRYFGQRGFPGDRLCRVSRRRPSTLRCFRHRQHPTAKSFRANASRIKFVFRGGISNQQQGIRLYPRDGVSRCVVTVGAVNPPEHQLI